MDSEIAPVLQVKFHFIGLPSKSKRLSIRKQIIVIITVNSLLVY